MHYGWGMGGFGLPLITGLLFIPISIWSVVWSGLALWVAAKRKQKGWFIFFLIVHTGGIGEILYLLLTDGFKELKD
jgi:ABC-type transport system involved in cytochrome c biogenesis permease subunit